MQRAGVWTQMLLPMANRDIFNFEHSILAECRRGARVVRASEAVREPTTNVVGWGVFRQAKETREPLGNEQWER